MLTTRSRVPRSASTLIVNTLAVVLTRVMGNTSPMFLSYEKVEAELHDTVKTKRGTQIKWRSLVTKLQLRKLAKQSNS